MEFLVGLLLWGWLLHDPVEAFNPEKHVEAAKQQCGQNYVIQQNATVDLDGNVKHFYCKIEAPKS